jgi:cysteine-rich repeat protein
MSARSCRLACLASLAALAPFLVHCGRTCPPRAAHVVGVRTMEKTLYGPALITARPRAEPLARTLEPFDRAALRVDVSRPVAAVLTGAAGAAELLRIDPSKLQPGDRGASFQVLALFEQTGRVALPAGDRAYDAIVLVPREPSRAPWEASVTVEMGRTVKSDPSRENCVDPGAPSPPLPEWSLASMPLHCGDGVRQNDEDCDDGNRAGGDGCGPYCVKER